MRWMSTSYRDYLKHTTNLSDYKHDIECARSIDRIDLYVESRMKYG